MARASSSEGGRLVPSRCEVGEVSGGRVVFKVPREDPQLWQSELDASEDYMVAILYTKDLAIKIQNSYINNLLLT